MMMVVAMATMMMPVISMTTVMVTMMPVMITVMPVLVNVMQDTMMPVTVMSMVMLRPLLDHDPLLDHGPFPDDHPLPHDHISRRWPEDLGPGRDISRRADHNYCLGRWGWNRLLHHHVRRIHCRWLHHHYST